MSASNSPKSGIRSEKDGMRVMVRCWITHREKPLDGDAAIHVDMPHAARLEVCQDIGGSPDRRSMTALGRGWQFASAQDEHRLLTVGPGVKGQTFS